MLDTIVHLLLFNLIHGHMDIAPLIAKLSELLKDIDVETYIIFKEMGDTFENDKTREYDIIEHSLKTAFREDIEARVTNMFINVNLRDFDFREIERQVTDAYHTHWFSRSQAEMERDKLLGWQYGFYSYHYTNSEKHKEITVAEKARLLAKAGIMLEIQEDFKNIFVQDLLENSIQTILQKNSQYENGLLFKAKADDLFKDRSSMVKERDTFGYIDIESYIKCAAVGFKMAKEYIQTDAKGEILEKFLSLARIQLNKENDTYFGNLRDVYYDLLESHYKSRSAERIEQDNVKLLDFETYLAWEKEAIDQIKKEYPKLFEVTEDDDSAERDDDLDFNDEWVYTRPSEYRQYGGYNGYDDQTIDDAFEGDPMNTWNVD